MKIYNQNLIIKYNDFKPLYYFKSNKMFEFLNFESEGCFKNETPAIADYKISEWPDGTNSCMKLFIAKEIE